jgi:DNA-binding NarL/FixJ family response regulator
MTSSAVPERAWGMLNRRKDRPDRVFRRERARAGGARRRGSAIREDLSPAELQVAIVVARGATNREAAAELFLSPKTVDHHLSAVYSKLGLRSRTELAHLMTTGSGPGPGASPSA